MLNMNSPTVQAMLRNSPNGLGNIPVYYGNTPQVQTEYIPSNQNSQNQTTFQYPSPKEMIIQQGQQNIYQPVAFNGTFYPSPYQNQYQYNGYGQQQSQFGGNFYQYQNPYNNSYNYYNMDEDTRDILQAANAKGITYEEQAESDSSILKLMSRIVSKQLGRTAEQAKKCEEKFNLVDRNAEAQRQNVLQQQYLFERRKNIATTLKVSIMYGDKVIKRKSDPVNNGYINNNEYSNSIYNKPNIDWIDRSIKMNDIKKMNREYAFMMMHNQSIERKYDNVDMLEFFNGPGSAEVISSMMQQRAKAFSNVMVGRVYDKAAFRNRIISMSTNKMKDKYVRKSVQKYVGRYGYLPNGIPISPQHDPAMSECFSYNPETGFFDVTIPNYMAKAFEGARSRFLKTIDDN